MSTAPTAPLVTVEDYLNRSWQPDMEYVDGMLIQRNLPTIAHALLQLILGSYLRQFEKQFGFKVLPEARTQIIERRRYRVPDLLLCPKPLPEGEIVNVSPWAVIEILSPSDRMGDTMDRFRDYEAAGVHAIVQMDPEKCIAHHFVQGSLIQKVFMTLDLPAGSVAFETEQLFKQLREELNER